MRLSAVHGDDVDGYTVVNSIHQVRKIFRAGFRDMIGAGRICFVRTEKDALDWAINFGIFIIKIKVPQTSIQYMGRSECGANPEGIKPIGWGVIYKDAVEWQDQSPDEFDIGSMRTDGLETWDVANIERDRKNNEDDAIETALLGRGWSYKSSINYTPEEYEHITRTVLGLADKGLPLVKAYRKSGLSMVDFHFGIVDLVANGRMTWSAFEYY